MKKIVIALGGNAIKHWNQKGSAEEQLENLGGSCSHMMKIIKKGYPIAITHGNGPQVGNLLIQREKSAREVPPQPLDVCDEMTQGQVGGLSQFLEKGAERSQDAPPGRGEKVPRRGTIPGWKHGP